MNEIIKIKISDIDDFKNHPYKVEIGDDLNDLVESIKLNGLLIPVVVRRKMMINMKCYLDTEGRKYMKY